jgi:hypothetical protein
VLKKPAGSVLNSRKILNVAHWGRECVLARSGRAGEMSASGFLSAAALLAGF